MTTQKHLNLTDRIMIKQFINDRFSFKEIGRELERDCTTISKEIRSHRCFKKTGSFGKSFNNCSHRMGCDVRCLCHLCTAGNNRFCFSCKNCIFICDRYEPYTCPKLSKPPYVCNGCGNINKCTLEKAFYDPVSAQKEYETLRSEARTGITISENEAAHLDEIISPLIRKGQSIHHICMTNPDAIMLSEKTVYNYVDYNIFTARNIDLPRKVRYRPRKKQIYFKVDKTCRIGRTYDDYLKFMKVNLDTPVVQIDSVEGIKGGKVLLTLHFVETEMMLAFIRDSNDSKSVIDIFERLYLELRPDIFVKLFRLLLGDNGSEFSNPKAIEFDSDGNRRTRMYYCDPSSPFQKGAAENNHEFIRRIIPKGTSLDSFCQSDIDLMMNHINSYGRKKLGDKSPYEAFAFIHGKELLEKLGCRYIPNKDIHLQPSLLKK
jgi:IS30 family transposase